MPRSLGHALPHAVAAALHGGAADSGTAVQLLTVDGSGRPHAALLSASEIVATSASTVRLGTYATSTTAANLRERGVATLIVVEGGGVHSLKGRVAELPSVAGYASIARFELRVEDVLVDATRDEEGGADVLTGITYRRHHPSVALGEMLRA